MIELGYAKPSKLPKKKKRTANPRKKLITECDDLVRVILWKTEDKCFVCGIQHGRYHPQDNPRGEQVGHFKSRVVYPLRWDLKNCHLQCARCNYIHENDALPFTLAMIKHGGTDLLEYLEQTHNDYRILQKTMPTWQIQEKKEELQATLDTLNGERTAL